jgi:hypothetical protein
MCNFFWKLCFCCNRILYAYSDSEFCGSVDCNVNYILPKMSKKYCRECVEKECNRKKQFCSSFILPEKYTVDKSLRSLTIFLGPGEQITQV